VLTDLIAKHQLDIEMFSLDNRALPQATYDLMQEVADRYSVPLSVFPGQCGRWRNTSRSTGEWFYGSVQCANCCYCAQVEPLATAR